MGEGKKLKKAKNMKMCAKMCAITLLPQQCRKRSLGRRI